MIRTFAPALAVFWCWIFGPFGSAADIVIWGDSWGTGIAASLTSVAESEGFTVDGRAVGGRRASQMVTTGGLAQISNDLNANPDAKVVHLIIGGNDFLGQWNAGQSSATQQAIFNSILGDIQTIANHIATVRPAVQMFHMGYDFPRPLPLGTPAQVNQAALTLAGLQHAISAPNYTYYDDYGLTQEIHGIHGNPPHGTSDPNFPGPATAFSDNIHLTQSAYLLFAERSLDTYRAALVPEPAGLTFLAVSMLGLAGCRRRRR